MVSAQAQNILVSEALGQVGETVVTARDVQMNHWLEKYLNTAGEKTSVPKNATLSSESEAFSESLGQSLLELVVLNEAENFSVGEVGPEERDELRKKFFDWSKGVAAWSSLEVSPFELDKLIYRKLRTRNFLKFKTETSGVQVSELEIEQYYSKNNVRFSGIPISQVRESIRNLLTRQQVEEGLKEWFEILKRKYRVRFLGRAKNS